MEQVSQDVKTSRPRKYKISVRLIRQPLPFPPRPDPHSAMLSVLRASICLSLSLSPKESSSFPSDVVTLGHFPRRRTRHHNPAGGGCGGRGGSCCTRGVIPHVGRGSPQHTRLNAQHGVKSWHINQRLTKTS